MLCACALRIKNFCYWKTRKMRWFFEQNIFKSAGDKNEKETVFFPLCGLFKTKKSAFTIIILVLSVLIITVSAFMLWNSSDLHNATDRVLFSFAGKVASQQASNINFRISNILQDLTLFGKSLFLSGRDQAAKNIEFIYQQTEELGFDSLIILNRTDPSKDFYTDTSLPDFRTCPAYSSLWRESPPSPLEKINPLFIPFLCTKMKK